MSLYFHAPAPAIPAAAALELLAGVGFSRDGHLSSKTDYISYPLCTAFFPLAKSHLKGKRRKCCVWGHSPALSTDGHPAVALNMAQVLADLARNSSENQCQSLRVLWEAKE